MTEEAKIETVKQALEYIQRNLKAPKNQYNSFGKYNYRSCEDILDGIKKVMPVGCTVYISDDIEAIGGRIYVKATVRLEFNGATIVTHAYAREEESKKGMDGSQVTGAASSYARKYALNALFMIDDTKDSDATNEHGKGEQKKADAKKEEKKNFLSADEIIEKIQVAKTEEELDAVSAEHKADIAHHMANDENAKSRIVSAGKAMREKLKKSAPQLDDEVVY